MINFKKFSFIKIELVYLVFVIYSEGLKVDPLEEESIKIWPSPINIHEVRSFHYWIAFKKKLFKILVSYVDR